MIELCIHPANEISFPKIEKNKLIYKKFTYSQNRFHEKKLLFYLVQLEHHSIALKILKIEENILIN